MRVDLLQGRLERRLGAGVLAGAFRGGQPPVRRVQGADPDGPRIRPGSQVLAVASPARMNRRRIRALSRYLHKAHYADLGITPACAAELLAAEAGGLTKPA